MSAFMENCGAILEEYLPLLGKGVLVTLEIAGLGALLGGALGLLIGFLFARLKAARRLSPVARTLLSLPLRFYCFLFRSVPFVLQAAVLHWGIAAANGAPLSPLFSGTLAISLCCGAHLAAPFRDAFGRWRESSGRERLVLFLLPFIGRFSENAGDVAVLHVIGVTGMYFYADVIRLQGHPMFESFLVVCLPYLGISFVLYALAWFLKRLARGRTDNTAEEDDGNGTVAESTAID